MVAVGVLIVVWFGVVVRGCVVVKTEDWFGGVPIEIRVEVQVG